MNDYRAGLLWGLVLGVPLVGAGLWAAKRLIDLHIEERSKRNG